MNIRLCHFQLNLISQNLKIGHQSVKFYSQFELFTFLVERQLPFSIQEKLIDVYPHFFIDMLTNILEQTYKSGFDENDLIVVKMDLNYQKLLRLCQLYQNAFRVAYTIIAKKMIMKNTRVLQKFLENFLTDVKSTIKISEIPYHYEDALVNYVLIFNECKVEDDEIVRHFANKLKESNYLHYFILLTHVSKFLYLLH